MGKNSPGANRFRLAKFDCKRKDIYLMIIKDKSSYLSHLPRYMAVDKGHGKLRVKVKMQLDVGIELPLRLASHM